MQQVFISVSLLELEGLFKKWLKESIPTQEIQREAKQILNSKEASSYLDLSLATIYSKSSRGELPTHRKNGRLYFIKSELENYIKSGRKPSAEQIQNQERFNLKMKGFES